MTYTESMVFKQQTKLDLTNDSRTTIYCSLSVWQHCVVLNRFSCFCWSWMSSLHTGKNVKNKFVHIGSPSLYDVMSALAKYFHWQVTNYNCLFLQWSSQTWRLAQQSIPCFSHNLTDKTKSNMLLQINIQCMTIISLHFWSWDNSYCFIIFQYFCLLNQVYLDADIWI